MDNRRFGRIGSRIRTLYKRARPVQGGTGPELLLLACAEAPHRPDDLVGAPGGDAMIGASAEASFSHWPHTSVAARLDDSANDGGQEASPRDRPRSTPLTVIARSPAMAAGTTTSTVPAGAAQGSGIPASPLSPTAAALAAAGIGTPPLHLQQGGWPTVFTAGPSSGTPRTPLSVFSDCGSPTAAAAAAAAGHDKTVEALKRRVRELEASKRALKRELATAHANNMADSKRRDREVASLRASLAGQRASGSIDVLAMQAALQQQLAEQDKAMREMEKQLVNMHIWSQSLQDEYSHMRQESAERMLALQHMLDCEAKRAAEAHVLNGALAEENSELRRELQEAVQLGEHVVVQVEALHRLAEQHEAEIQRLRQASHAGEPLPSQGEGTRCSSCGSSSSSSSSSSQASVTEPADSPSPRYPHVSVPLIMSPVEDESVATPGSAPAAAMVRGELRSSRLAAARFGSFNSASRFASLLSSKGEVLRASVLLEERKRAEREFLATATAAGAGAGYGIGGEDGADLGSGSAACTHLMRSLFGSLVPFNCGSATACSPGKFVPLGTNAAT